MESLVQDALQSAPAQEGMKVGEANIAVMGCGGAGNNMVSWLHKKGIHGAKIYAVNTDQQHLDITQADKKVPHW